MKLVAFDLDGTLLHGTKSIWKSIYEVYAPSRLFNRKELLRAHLSGKLSYEDWFNADLNAFRENGVTEAAIKKLSSSYSVAPEAEELLAELKRRDCKIAVISGGIKTVFDLFFSEEQFDFLFINEIYFDSTGKIVGGKHTPFDMEYKPAALKFAAEKAGIPLSETIFVGDNDNDCDIAKATALSLAVKGSSEALLAVSDFEIESLNEILEYI